MPHPSKNYGPWSPIAVVFLAVLGVAALAAVVMYLWNTILHPVVGVKTITIWQALGLFILSRILFGRFGGWGGKRRTAHHQRKKAWREKWKSMSEEERAAFKARWREKRWGHHSHEEEGEGD